MRDRRATLKLGLSGLNGIDFVEVSPEQTRLFVHFLVEHPDRTVLSGALRGATITGGDSIPEALVVSKLADGWSTDADGLPLLALDVAAPGDFSTYTLQLETSASVLDPHFDHVAFSFKAGCPSTLDCEAVPPDCSETDGDIPPIDYLAKDFDSFKKALSDFSALRYPAWQERSEADFGVMFMEALSSLADDLSYQQDRIAAEAWLETATERLSLLRLARVVDYEPRPATAARVMLRLEVGAGTHSLQPGIPVSAVAPDGEVIAFETGTGLQDRDSVLVSQAWNRIPAYYWDDAEACLHHGATELWIEHPGVALREGQRVLIETAQGPGESSLRQIVRLVAKPDAKVDRLFNKLLLRIRWGSDDALSEDRDLKVTTVAANIVPATQGRRYREQFATQLGLRTPPGVARAVVRTGAGSSLQFLHTLRRAPLTWLEQDDPWEKPRPELRVTELGAAGREWLFRRSLLDGNRLPREVFTVDPMAYRALGVEGAADYDGVGDTLRFGDGVFGAIPAKGTVFEVVYRAGAGARGNVAAGAINQIDRSYPDAALIAAVDNPLAAEGGQDAEPLDHIRELAPQAFRAKLYRAVRAEDYELAAKELGWVQRAGTAFRYTGSWLSVFTAVDPHASESVSAAELLELTRLQDRRRLAGYEAFAQRPRYAPLDLAIQVCALPDAFRGDVKRDVLVALDTAHFFHPDRFSFGVPLERSLLEDAIQDVLGVDGVVDVRYRRRGHGGEFATMPDALEIAKDEIVRVDNNPSRPERGSLRIEIVGGK